MKAQKVWKLSNAHVGITSGRASLQDSGQDLKEKPSKSNSNQDLKGHVFTGELMVSPGVPTRLRLAAQHHSVGRQLLHEFF